MEDVKIILSTSWVALMLTYLLGMCCEYTAATLSLGNRRYENKSGSVVGSCSADGDSGCHGFPLPDVELSCEWANIIVAIVFLGFNLIGLPGYPSAYDKFLIIVGLVFNVLTVWYAWQWSA